MPGKSEREIHSDFNPLYERNNIKPAMKLKRKYTVTFTPKFGGQKRSTSNSGGVGRAARRKRRGGK